MIFLGLDISENNEIDTVSVLDCFSRGVRV